ncbi:MAG: T9SS type A sorting domain-containing protein [Bacteroidales bacterium]|nr:T9SS type A sorting domain-containing protein [Bacteroidales bacterium]
MMRFKIFTLSILMGFFGLFSTNLLAQDATITADEIQYWIGEGENEVVVAISWCSYTETALAWGYRFDGEATVFQALTDIAAADDRLTVVGSAPTNVTYLDDEYNLTMCTNPAAQWGDPDYDIPMHSVNGLMGQNMMSAEPIQNGDFVKVGGYACGVMSSDWTMISWATEIIPATDPNAGGEVVDATISADEIQYWIGEGQNEVVVAISWCSYTETALAWGYRFDGEATVFQALTDIAAADDRLTVVGSAPTNVTYLDDEYDLTMCPNPAAQWGDPDYDIPMHSVNGLMGQNTMATEPIQNGDFVKIGGYACSVMSSDWTTIAWETPIVPATNSTGVNELGNATVSVYPNPAANEAYVTLVYAGLNEVTVYDMQGRMVCTMSVTASEGEQVRISTAELNEGVYFVSVKSEGNVGTAKLVVK